MLISQDSFPLQMKRRQVAEDIQRKKARPRDPSLSSPSKRGSLDPSLEFISAPLKAFAVQASRKYFKAKDVGFTVHLGEKHGWRTIAKLAVRGSGDLGLVSSGQSIGLFAPGSHTVVPMVSSPVHHPLINSATRLFERLAVQASVTGYREAVDQGVIKYLLLAVDLMSARVQMVIVVHLHPTEASSDPGLNRLIALISEESQLVQSLWVHYNRCSKHNSSITGREDDSWKCVHGSNDLALEMPLDQVSSTMDTKSPLVVPRLFFPPTVFRQANIGGFAKIIDCIRSFVSQNARVLELYGGVGTIGLNCFDLVKRLECSDENPYNVDCFAKSIDDLCSRVSDRKAEKLRAKLKYLHCSAKDRASGDVFHKWDILIVDPPRKGLDEEVVNELVSPSVHSKNRLKRVIYVSCGWKAFQRDCDRLLSSMRWKIVHAEGHLLFPGSDHIETLAIFDRDVTSIAP